VYTKRSWRVRGCEDLEVYNSARETEPAELDFPAVVELTGVSDCTFLARLPSVDTSPTT